MNLEAYKKLMDARIKEAEAGILKMKARSKESEGRAMMKYDEALSKLDYSLFTLKRKAEKLGDAQSGNWEEIKENLDENWSNFKEELDRLFAEEQPGK